MDQLRDLADERLLRGCIYCDSGLEDTRDHVPSKILLDLPYPTNLPVVPACNTCNNGFSRDEEYLACLIECAISGTTNPDSIQNPRITKILRRSPALLACIETGRKVINGIMAFEAEEKRINNILLKLAMGHVAFELSLPLRREPKSLMWWPMSAMTEEERDSYDASHVTKFFGEVGSRNMQRLLVTQMTLKSPKGELSTVNLVVNDWIDVQEGKYRYLAIDDKGEIRIKIVLSEFLACEVFWAGTSLENN